MQVEQFVGIWDTGATGSVITKKIIDAVGLQPTGQTQVGTAGGTVITNTYLVNLTLPMGLMIPNLVVTEGNLTGADALIGMDVITLGDFTITNLKGHTVMNFRVPSMVEYNYVSEGDKYNALQARKELPPRAPHRKRDRSARR
jgi:predicted aspartyl protease